MSQLQTMHRNDQPGAQHADLHMSSQIGDPLRSFHQPDVQYLQKRSVRSIRSHNFREPCSTKLLKFSLWFSVCFIQRYPKLWFLIFLQVLHVFTVPRHGRWDPRRWELCTADALGSLWLERALPSAARFFWPTCAESGLRLQREQPGASPAPSTFFFLRTRLDHITSGFLVLEDQELFWTPFLA